MVKIKKGISSIIIIIVKEFLGKKKKNYSSNLKVQTHVKHNINKTTKIISNQGHALLLSQKKEWDIYWCDSIKIVVPKNNI